MTTTEVITPDLKTVLRRLKLSRMLDTLPERLTLARQQKMPHQQLRSRAAEDRRGRPAHPRRLCDRRPRHRRESRPLRPAARAVSHRVGDCHFESRPGRMARHLCRSRPGPERDRSFTSNAYDLVIEGDSYRPRLKPRLAKDRKERSR
jgi:hypothetical protein